MDEKVEIVEMDESDGMKKEKSFVKKEEKIEMIKRIQD